MKVTVGTEFQQFKKMKVGLVNHLKTGAPNSMDFKDVNGSTEFTYAQKYASLYMGANL